MMTLTHWLQIRPVGSSGQVEALYLVNPYWQRLYDPTRDHPLPPREVVLAADTDRANLEVLAVVVLGVLAGAIAGASAEEAP